ncbi:MAG: CotH kinase family protein, partial [Planctomycetota bacterium]
MALLIIVLGLFAVLPQRDDILSRQKGLSRSNYLEFKARLESYAFPTVDERSTLRIESSLSVEPRPNRIGGFYDHPITISLSADEKNVPIYYTLDGSIPTKRSLRFQRPIKIDETTVLRFRSCQPGYLPSVTVTHTYLVGADCELPVLSLVANPSDLWDKDVGIYANPEKRGRHWQRAAHVEYVKDKASAPLRLPVELRIHGGSSRNMRKKSFRLTYPLACAAGMDVGNILTEESTDLERIVILRSGGQNKNRLRDELFHTLYAKAGGLTSAFTPCILLLNGRMWGIYNIREHINEDYLKRKVGEGNYHLMYGMDVFRHAISGDKEDWSHIFDFFMTHELAGEEEFKRASEFVDIDNLTDYWLFNIYAANMDWPHANLFLFRRRDDQADRWRCICWDADATFDFAGQGLKHNSLAWATRSQLRQDLTFSDQGDYEGMLDSTLIVRRLLGNEHYKRKFIRRFCDLLSSHFVPERVEAELNRIIEASVHDLPKDWNRWSISAEDYWEDVQSIRTFIYDRPEILLSHFRREFGLGRVFAVELFNDPAEAGAIQVNSIRPQDYPWTGRYFEGSSIVLTAEPLEGFEFLEWTAPSLGKS